LGDKEAAMAMLEKALRTDDSAFLLLPLDEDFASLRGEKRYEKVLEERKAMLGRD
jgi:hypothetical protein